MDEVKQEQPKTLHEAMELERAKDPTLPDVMHFCAVQKKHPHLQHGYKQPVEAAKEPAK